MTQIGIARDAEGRAPAVTGRRRSGNSSVADRRPAVTGRRGRAASLTAAAAAVLAGILCFSV